MEEHEILERLYQEARKTLPKLQREISARDLDLCVKEGWAMDEDSENKGINLRKYQTTGGYGWYKAIETESKKTLSLRALREEGFSSETPPLSEFLKKNGLEKEISTFVELYGLAINARYAKALEREGKRREEDLASLRESLEHEVLVYGHIRDD